MFDENELKFYDKHGKARPSHVEHGEDSYEHPISERMNMAKNVGGWRAEGNRLICDTEFGQFVQMIPVDKIFVGTGTDGNPILKDIYKH